MQTRDAEHFLIGRLEETVIKHRKTSASMDCHHRDFEVVSATSSFMLVT